MVTTRYSSLTWARTENKLQRKRIKPFRGPAYVNLVWQSLLLFIQDQHVGAQDKLTPEAHLIFISRPLLKQSLGCGMWNRRIGVHSWREKIFIFTMGSRSTLGPTNLLLNIHHWENLTGCEHNHSSRKVLHHFSYWTYCVVLYCGRVPAANAPGWTAAEGLLYKPWSLVDPTCTARCLHQRP